MHLFFRLCWQLLLFLCIGVLATSSTVMPHSELVAQITDDLANAQAIITKRCLCCHGPEKQKGSLRLDSTDALLQGGTLGTALDQADPEKSLLLQRVRDNSPETRMPPEGKRLTVEEISLLEKWLRAGAPLPNKTSSQPKHWSFQPIQRPVPPLPATSLHPIDQFIHTELNRHELKPSPTAPRYQLIRRLYLDLLGLLPTPEAVASFEADTQPDAYARLVDRLLGSEHFGERWARHWLDLARYGDSDGLEHDEPRKHAYHYRDWVISAYNRDLPFDQFTIEQLAGDLLPHPTTEQLLASSFHRQTLKHNTSEMFSEEHRVKTIKDRVNTTGSVWMGLTVGCAECHHHKHDPITQQDYYQLYAFFNDADEHDYLPDNKRVMSFKFKERPSHVMPRGQFPSIGPSVVPQMPASLPGIKSKAGRLNRLDLARWLVSAEHPLTARVEVNRIWQHLFGQGLVSTPDDFGTKGALPSHAALLDWLASEFQAVGWSRKKLIKQIVCSQTYQQSSQHRKDLKSRDPLNRLLARQNRFRVESEIIYDIALQAAGLLQLDTVGGESFQPAFPRGLDTGPIKNNRLVDVSEPEEGYRRGIYIQTQRTFQHPLLMTLDTPDGNQSCARRERTNSPAQALLLLNDPNFHECARAFGRLLAEGTASNEERIRMGMLKALGRPPRREETVLLVKLLEAEIEANHSEPWSVMAGVLLNLEAFTTRE